MDNLDGSVGQLGSTDLGSDNSTIIISISVDRHRNADAFAIFETLVHEMCHAFVMAVAGDMDDHHGVPWQTLALAVRRTLSRVMGREVEMGEAVGARGDMDGRVCRHFSPADREKFFGDDAELKDYLECRCFESPQPEPEASDA